MQTDFAAVDPAAVSEYLLRSGWTLVSRTVGVKEKWWPPGSEFEVMVPFNRTYKDYGPRMVEALALIASHEQRLRTELVDAITGTGPEWTDTDSPLRDTDPELWGALRAADTVEAVPVSAVNQPTIGAELWMAGRRLARLVRRDYRADDVGVVTAEWLQGAGFAENRDDTPGDRLSWYWGSRLEVLLPCSGVAAPRLYVGRALFPAKLPITRGTVRRVSRELGIVLKEGE